MDGDTPSAVPEDTRRASALTCLVQRDEVLLGKPTLQRERNLVKVDAMELLRLCVVARQWDVPCHPALDELKLLLHKPQTPRVRGRPWRRVHVRVAMIDVLREGADHDRAKPRSVLQVPAS